MQSGFTGGGGGGGLPDFYSAGRSIATAMNNPSQPPYGRSPSLPALFLDQTASRIPRQNPHAALIGKRTLAEFQSHQGYLTNGLAAAPPNSQALAAQASYLRTVKPRPYQHSSPISPLSPIEFSPSTPASENSSFSSSSPSPSSQRFGLPILHQLRPQPTSIPYNVNHNNNNNYNNGAVLQNRVMTTGAVVQGVDSEKKMMNHKLLELEKQLLDDIDEEDGDPASAITTANGSSEWSETIQNLIVTPQKPPVSPSPTSSSSSSSSSVASSGTTACAKQSIVEAASAISEGRTEAASEILTRLLAFSAANSRLGPEQKALDFTAAALRSRVSPAEYPAPVTELFGPDHAAATQSLHEISPCFALGLSAANVAIIDATLSDNNSNRVHVVDFDIGQGVQYASLLHSLAARQKSNGNNNNNSNQVAVKITTLADGSERDRSLKAVTEKLAQLSEKLGIRLEVRIVSVKVGELSRETLGCEPDEPIAVSFAFKLYRTPDESVSMENPRDELLRRVKALAPRVVVLVEQELNTNTAPFVARVNETCAYYGALMESIDAMAGEGSSERVARAEEAVSRKLVNSVACEGRERVERCEVFGKWRARMGMAGFELKPLSQNVTTRLSSKGGVHPSFSVKVENGGICFGWMGRTLTVASTWR